MAKHITMRCNVMVKMHEIRFVVTELNVNVTG